MSAQVTVRLPEELNRALDAAADRTHRKRSEIVRLALSRFLGLTTVEEKPADRVRPLLGSLESGIPDLAENHRQYLLESMNGE